jgi:arabinofuranan 3-O-arabinosyltransferase
MEATAPVITHPPTRQAEKAGKLVSPAIQQRACCLFLAALPFATAPGDIIADTKFELVIGPSGFLSGAFTVWNPQQFGGLLNQAVGYLFPMGPFFEVLRLLSVEGWMVQRLWIGALLIAAFTGVVRLAGRLRIGTPGTRSAAGLAYALSPAALGIIGVTSGEFLPMAIMPWIMIPLTDKRPWTGKNLAARARVTAQSAVAVALCSGMNAASAVAVFLPVLVYILTRPGRRIRMLAWWVPAVALVTASWTIPLVLLGRYGVSVVPYTESAQVTTSSTSLLNIFRGTENWVGYLVVNGQIWRPLAFQLATGITTTVLTGLLAALGLAGLTHRQLPERRFLLWSAIIGVLIISLGYVSSLGNPLEGHLIALVNGPASPFRNLWKFDPMLRLPLALGLAHLLTTKKTRALAALALAGLAVPALTTGLASDGAFSQVPSYWVSAAGWLTAHGGNQAVLVEPGAPFGQYLWGSPMDDVLQALTNVDYAERNLSIVGSAGNERLLNSIDQLLAAGRGSAGLTQALARMGVKYVLVRNDLSRPDLSGAWPARIDDALAASPGITLAATFGPQVSGLPPDDATTDFDAPYPAVQIYQVKNAEPAAVVQSAAGTLRVYGAPESLITLADEGLLGNRPVLVNDDGAGQPVAGSVLTDSLRRRIVNFGQLRTNYSPTLTSTEPADTFLSARDYTEPGWSRYQSVARYTGVHDVTASSSASDIKAFSTQWASGALPFAAVDGNLGTAWVSGSWSGPVGQWLQVDFDAPVDPHVIQTAFVENASIGPPVAKVTVTTAAGQVSDPVNSTGHPQPLQVPPGASGWLRITITGLAYQPPAPVFGPQAGIAEITVPGVSAARSIVAPTMKQAPSTVVLAKAQPQPSGCMLTSLRWVCSPQLRTTTEEQSGFDHTFTEPEPGSAPVTSDIRGSAILTDPSLADRYARLDRYEPTATASSTYTSDPQDQPRSAFDGNKATAWIASPADPHPTLRIRWGYPRTIDQLTIKRPPGASPQAPVLITGSSASGGSGVQARGAMVGPDGVVKFAPMTTTGLSLIFTPVQAPVQVTDVTIPGVPFISTPAVPFRLPCGLGPQLQIDGQPVPTSVSGTFTDLLTGAPMQFTGCSPVTLAAGANQVTEPQNDAFDIQNVALTAPAIPPDPGPAAATVESWSSSLRKLHVTTTERSYLIVNENFNLGWRATMAGHPLPPVRLDGWEQAWILPANVSGTVTLTYRPESLYRDAVIGGLAALALVILLALALHPRRSATKPRGLWDPLDHESPTPSEEPQIQPWSHEHQPWPTWLRLVLACPILAGAGLLLGGYPGALLVPAATLLILFLDSKTTTNLWLAALLIIAAACGAVGEHLALSGDIGLLVSAPANAIPQVICLIVFAALPAALLRPDHD